MKVFDSNNKINILAVLGYLVLALGIGLRLSGYNYGIVVTVFILAIGAVLVGISTGNKKFISETKAIIYIVLTVLMIKVTVLEAYIVTTGSMENTIMT